MDAFCEYMVKRKIGIKEWLISALIIIIALVLIFLSLPWLFLGITAVFDAAVVYFSYVLISRFSVEYEYVLTNSELDIDKIYAKRKRDRVLSIDIKKFEICTPVGSQDAEADIVKDFSSRTGEGAYFALFNDDGKKVKIIFNPSRKMLDIMKMYSPEKINI